MRLFHISEESGIKRFEPRPVPSPKSGVDGKAVWAIDEEHLANYLLPRDCPRVTYRIAANTTPEDRARFFAGSECPVIAAESQWYSRIAQCHLFLYEMPRETFALVDSIAGYHISRAAVTPNAVIEMTDPISEILRRGIELRFLPDLWPLRNAVANSTVEFSIIRMRNAEPSRRL